MTTSNINRRTFAKSTGIAASALAAAPAINALGANEKINLGLIGLGGRGSHHTRQFVEMADANIVSLCDPYMPNVEQNAERVGHDVQKTQDFRKVLENKDVDAVVIATPDHWHAIITILACQAGKDVYVEKPMTHTIEEGKRVIEAEKYYNRVIQVGQQQRSSQQFIQSVEMVKNGEIGHVTSARCINIWPIFGYLSKPITAQTGAKLPEGLDYDLWLGPAPKRDFDSNHFLFNFYFFIDYAGGMLTGWGVHLFDIVMWAMGHEMKRVTAIGGKYANDDLRDTPDTLECVFDTPGYTLGYSLRHGNGFPDDPDEGNIDHGIYFYGDKATILVNRNHAKIYPENDRSLMKLIEAKGGDIEHKQNFLDCVKSRKKPTCTVLEGHYANLPCMLALISWRVGSEVEWDTENETIVGNADAIKLMSKNYRKPWVLPKVG